jgi:glycosyltransferase involved in cell wall biosynthesis
MILSILIPTYNRPKEAIEALKSCLDFVAGEIEVLIGDDSELNQEDLFKSVKLPSNYSLRYYHRWSPLKQNRNVADLILKANGKYSLILHDDDYLLGGALEKMITQAESSLNTNVIYYGKQILINDNNEMIFDNNLNQDYFRTNEYCGLQKDNVMMALLQQVPSNSFLFPTVIGKKIGYRDYEEVGDACDFDFIIRLVLIGNSKLFFINDEMSGYRLSNQSVSKSKNYNSIFFKYKIINELNLQFNNPLVYKKLIIKDLNILCGYYANNKLRNELKDLYFSNYYPLNKRFTVRGIYHFLKLFI